MNATLIQRSMQAVIVAVLLLMAGVWAIFLPGPTHAYSVVLHDPDEFPISPGQPFLKYDLEEPLSIRLPDSFMDQAFANVPASWKIATEVERAKRLSWISARTGATEYSLRRFLKNPSNGLMTEERECLDRALNLQVTTRMEDTPIRRMNCWGPTDHQIKMTNEARLQAWAGLWVVLGGTAILGVLQTRKFREAHQSLQRKYGI